MGKGILIIVLGVSAIITILMANLNANSSAGVESTVDFYKSTQARLIANSGIEVYLEKMRRDKTLAGNFLNNQLMNGNYDLYISGPDTLLKIRALGKYMNINHSSLVTARRRPMKVPSVNSALYISAANINLHLNGNVDINGNDHNINGSPGPEDPLPGVGVDDAGDSSFVINNIKPKISESILGYGGEPSVYTVDNSTNWYNLTEDLIFSADTVLSTGTYSEGAQFGTQSSPIITYCNGNVDFSDATGYGIMIVNGNVNLSGNFRFYGIVIVYGQSTIRTQTIGNNGIYGSTILVGETVDIESQGNAKFYYSSEAINNAKINLKSSRFEILSWWE